MKRKRKNKREILKENLGVKADKKAGDANRKWKFEALVRARPQRQLRVWQPACVLPRKSVLLELVSVRVYACVSVWVRAYLCVTDGGGYMGSHHTALCPEKQTAWLSHPE